ncbi:MAG: DNA polymerase III subunit delta [Pseudomonadota bacterium]
MQLGVDRIAGQVSQGLKPIYLISGDEPLQVLETADAVRAAAREQGLVERLVFEVDKSFDWNRLASDSANLSLFASRRLLDLRLPTGKPGREGGAANRAFSDKATEEGDVLLITAGKIEKASRNSAWVKAIDRIGIFVTCWPLKPAELPQWLSQRFISRGVAADAAACRALASRIEGNLLAAAQEVDKLALLKAGGTVTVDDIEEAVADNARFDVFKLSDAALEGDLTRALRVARALALEAAPLPVVAWTLTRESRLLLNLRQAMDTGANVQAIYRANAVWDARKNLLQRAMRRLNERQLTQALEHCALLDRQTKGLAAGDPWQSVEALVTLLCLGRQPMVSQRAAQAS